MNERPVDDPILKRFRAALEEIYGDRLERVVLFGSRARGDARLDSDYDVAVFLENFVDRWQRWTEWCRSLQISWRKPVPSFIRCLTRRDIIGNAHR